jgi:mannose-6-phosphate isomerase-like protein (cupin superfamily)
MKLKSVLIGLLSLLATFSCTKAPDDPFCRYEPLPASAGVPAGQGGVQITASADEYFYILDKTGKEITHGRLNMSASAKPGDYVAKVNNSIHPVQVREKTLTKCSAGTVLLRGSTDEYYYVLDSTGHEMAHNKLGRGLAFFPGKYTLQVNSTPQEFEVKPDAVTEIQAGILTVPGSTDEYYYVLDSTGRELAHQKLSRPLAFMPGARTVKVNNTSATVQIAAGSLAELKTGALLMHGTTDEYYYVFSATGNELAHHKLEGPLSFVEGDYTIKVNNTAMPVKVEAGKTNEYQTATLSVKSAGDQYYYVLDRNGTELGHNKLNAPLAFPEGTYSVKVANETRPVTLTAAKITVLNW